MEIKMVIADKERQENINFCNIIFFSNSMIITK